MGGEEVTRRKPDLLKAEILKIITGSDNPFSTQDLALKLSKPWHSIQTRCLKLHIENKIKGFRVGRINLWQSL